MNKFHLLLLLFFYSIFCLSQTTSEYKHLILYGQSFSTGNQSYPPISTENVEGNYMIGDQVWITNGNTDFSKYNPLISTIAKEYQNEAKTKSVQTFGESPVVGLTNHVQKQDNVYQKPKINYIATASGEGGQSLESLSKRYRLSSKENFYNDYFLKTIKSSAEIARSNNYVISCPAIFWMQGEFNYTGQYDIRGAINSTATQDKETYKRYMVELKEDMQADIKAAYNQAENPVFISYQAGNLWNVDDLRIGMAQVEASNLYSDIICAGPTYHLPHRGIHLEPNGYRWFGEMLGKVYYKTQVLNEDFKPLQPKKISRTNSEIIIEFHVPKLPLVFDGQILERLPNYGFKVKKNGVELAIGLPRIENNKVIISGADFSGSIEILYGVGNRRYPNGDFYAKGGNLRDSDDYKSFYTYTDLDVYPKDESLRPLVGPGNLKYGDNYPLYNFSVAFTYTFKGGENYKIMPGFFTSDILYVKKGSNGDGSSWSNALGELSDALEIAIDQNYNKQIVKQIWVAKGTYIPTVNQGNRGREKDRMFLLPKDVKIYGGFVGSETSLIQRDWENNETVLSGDIKGNDTGTTNNTDNVYHVVVASGDVGTTALDGFTISGGNANSVETSFVGYIVINGYRVTDNSGGAIFVSGSAPVFKNLNVVNSQSYYIGGGIRHLDSTVYYENISVTGNKAFGNIEYGGGGIYNDRSTVTIINGLIADNTSNFNGGGIYNDTSTLKLINVTLTSNIAGRLGQGLYNDKDPKSSIEMYNTVVWKNEITNANTIPLVYYYSFIEGVTTADEKGNLSGDIPLIFKDFKGKDYRLHPMNYVINKGNNAYINTISQDLDGKPRIVGPRVDLGAFEYPNEENCLWEEVVFDGLKTQYNEQQQQYNIENLPNNVSAIYIYTGINGTEYPESVTPPVNVGEYEVLATLTHASLDCKKVLSATLTINKIPYPSTVKFEPLVIDYDGDEHTLVVTGFPTGTQLEYGGDYQATNAGEYTGTVTLKNPNYQDQTLSTTLTINKIPYPSTVKFEPLVIDYDGDEHTLVVTGFPTGTQLEYGGDYQATNAGEYTGTVTLKNPNYQDQTLSTTLTINKIPYPSTVKFEPLVIDYDGDEHTLVVTGFPTGTQLEYGGDYQATNAGEYTGTVTLKNPNYQDQTLSTTLTINKIPYPSTVKFEPLVIDYDGDEHTLVVTGFPTGTQLEYGGDYQATNAGEYTGTVTLKNPNYQDQTLNATLTINKAQPKITIHQTEFIYDGTPKTVKVTLNHQEVSLDPLEYHTNAGTYRITVTAPGSSNYLPLNQEVILVINKIPYPSTVKFESLVIDYDGDEHTLVVTGFPTGTQLEYGGDYQATNAGEYTGTVTLKNPNYQDQTLSTTLTINKIPYPSTVKFEPLVIDYDGDEHTLVVTGFPTGTQLEYGGDYQATNAGEYTGTVTLKNPNYQDQTLSTTLTINKIPYPSTVKFEPLVIDYDGDEHTLVVTGFPTGTQLEYGGDYQATNAGEYTGTVTLKNPNYQDQTLSTTLTINKIPYPSTVKFEPLVIDYDGDEHTLVVTGFPTGTQLEYGGDYQATNAGEYTGTVTLKNPNYQDQTLSTTLTINKIPYPSTVKFEPLVIDYDGDEHTLVVTGFPTGTQLEYGGDYQATNAGEYTGTVTLKNPNYQDQTLNATLTINKAQPKITIHQTEFIYDGTPKTVKVTLNHQEVSLDPLEYHTNAGTYRITVTAPGSSNYLPLNQEVILVINKIPYPSTVKFEPLVIDYDGDEHTLVVTGFPTGTQLEYGGDYQATNAGEYTGTVTLKNPNYQDQTLSTTLTINKIPYPSTVKFEPLVIDYDGDEHTLVVTGFPTGTQLEYGGDYQATNAGEYTGTVTLKNPNYQDQTLSTTLTINKIPYPSTVKFEPLVIDYDGDEHTLVVTGFPTGTQLEYGGDYQATNAGEYTGTVTLKNPNYQDQTLSTTLTINKIPYPSTVKFEPLVIDYDGDEHTLVVTGFPTGTQLEYGGDYQATNAGEYTGTVTLKNPNYQDQTLNATLTINKAQPKITIHQTEFIYDGTPKTVKVTLNHQEVSLDPLEYHTNAGTYRITVTAPGSSNYLPLNQEVILVINKIPYPSTVKFESLVIDYDGDEHTLVVTGFPTGTQLEYGGDYQATNAGEYTGTVTLKNPNYQDQTLSTTLTINKIPYPSTVKFEPLVIDYDGDEHTLVVTGFPTGTQLEYGGDYQATNAGEYTGTVTLKNPNYQDQTLSTTLTINKIPYPSTVKFEPLVIDYDGDEHTLVVTGFPTGTQLEYGGDYQATNAGEYTGTVTLKNPNYQDQTLSTTLTINKIPYPSTVKFEPLVIDYDGDEHTLVVTGFPTGTQLEYGGDYQATNAGEYTGTVTLKNPNYQDQTLSTTLTINKIPYPSTVKFEPLVIDYDGDEHTLVVTGFPTGTQLEYGGDYQATNAGEYTGTVTLKNPNYQDQTLNATLTINKAQPKITIHQTEFIYDGTPKTVKVTLNHQEVSLDPLEYHTNAGTYRITVTAPGSSNYLPLNQEVILVINKIPYPSTVKFEPLVIDYDGDEHTLVVTGFPTGTQLEYGGDYQATNAGEYTGTVTLKNPNYQDQTLSTTLTINKIPYPSTVKFEPLVIDYDGDEHTLVVTGFPTGTQLEYGGDYQATNAGEYTGTVTLKNPNYQDQTLSTTLTINKIPYPSTVKFEPLVIDYDGDEHTLVVTGFPTGTQLEYGGDYQATNAGEYTGTVTLKNPNYQDQTLSTTLTINKIPYPSTVKFEPLVIDYDGDEHTLVVTGFPTGTQLEYGGDYQATNAGEYTGTVTLKNPNYQDQTLNATLTINKAQPKITIHQTEFIYDGTPKTVKVTLNHQEVSLDPLEYHTNAGTYRITVTAPGSSNYLPLNQEVILVINKIPYPSTVKFEPLVIDYDGDEHTLVVTGFPTGTQLEYGGDYQATNAGEYTGTVTLKNPNYQDQTLNATLTINKAQPKITIHQTEFIYDGAPKTVKVTLNHQEVSLDPLEYHTNAGTYRITVTAPGSSNYLPLNQEVILVINKALAVITAEDKQEYVYDGEVKNVIASLNHKETELEFNPKKDFIEEGTYIIKVTSKETTNYLSAEKIITLIITSHNAKPDIVNNKIIVFPNPFITKLKVLLPEASQREERVVIYEVTGKYIKTKKVSAGEKEVEIDFSGLYNGVYILKYKNTHIKIIKNEQ